MAKEIQWLLKEKYRGRLTLGAKKDIARLKKGEPLDYVIGFADFAGCKIDLSLRPLIPRPETEYWTLQAIEEIKNRAYHPQAGTDPALLRVLDLFAGSGCIGISVLKHILQARVDFGEKDQRLLRQIRLNARLNHIDSRRWRILEVNMFEKINTLSHGTLGQYDYIFANPPYVALSRWKNVQQSVAKYESRKALVAGKDGLLFIRRFLQEAKNHLRPEGKIYMEFDSPQKRAIDQFLHKEVSALGYAFWEFHKDQYGKWRYATLSV